MLTWIPLMVGCMGHGFHSDFYVSKLGDDSDGRSWQTAFHTIQAALNSVPDNQGGYRIIIRPDTYMEPNLYPAHRGAFQAYNLMVGDVDGRLGSGACGHVVIDSGDSQRGFKSYDWWGTIRAHKKGWSAQHTDETFSAIDWDRWILRNLYGTGGDGGFMFDCVDHIEPFTVIVEDCVSIGRAFGGGVASCLSRPDEPIIFRRCHFWALDWWGDTAAGYVRIENPSMPEQPDVLFEECTLVSPQCALKVGNYGFTTFSHVQAKRCRFIALNFSQPHGTPTDGIIQSVEHGRFLRIDLENSALMGYKVFGVTVNKDTEDEIQHATQGSVLAYVQFQQEIPDGMHRMGHFPVDVFQALVPPIPKKAFPHLISEGLVKDQMCELSPFIWQGKLCHMECVRPGSGGKKEDYALVLKDALSDQTLTRFAQGYGLASIHVHQDTLYVFASRWEDGFWNDVTLFKSSDLKHWDQEVVIHQENEHLFNSSVCEDSEGFVMAYESSDPSYPAFTLKFARSKDLETWTKVPDAVFGTKRYTACPCIRYIKGIYYLLYLEMRTPRHFFETYVARSMDLKDWELSRANPVLRPDQLDEGVNASDPEIIEIHGTTYLYFAVGDQRTWMKIKRARFDGSMRSFFEAWFDLPGIPDVGTAMDSGDA